MAFARIQGKKILILNSERKDGRIIQKKIHTFDTFSDAKQTVDTDVKWDLFCDTLQMQFDSNLNRNKLRNNIIDKLKDINFEYSDPINDAAMQILYFLKNLNSPLSPKQKSTIALAKNNLKKLIEIIDEKAPFFEEDSMLSIAHDEDAEKCLDDGLGFYRQGEWDKAKMLFLQGLKIDPNHVDLLVHAGLIEYIHENYSPALTYFDNAVEIGKQFTDLMLATDPNHYVKRIDIDRWAADKMCVMVDECPEWETGRCDDCDHNPKNQKTELYRHLEFRPFFRSLTNKALALMKLKKFQDAIDTLKLCQEYQNLLGTYNQIGICYLNLGNLKKADSWYRELFWKDAFYVKALIKHLIRQNEDAIKYLLTGIIKNPHIANMLIGLEKPEKIRYLGDTLPDNLSASEFIHEEGYLFKSHPDFRILIRCILEHEEIADLLKKLEKEKYREKKDRDYTIERFYWDLLHGNIDNEFIDKYVSKLLERLNNKRGAYWKPKENDMLEIQIIERKQQNWLAKLRNIEKKFYFRPKGYIEEAGKADIMQIRVIKSWFYRKSLFVSGEVKL
ncbi:MAG: hypothetical protein GY870_20160 [archaeon]|nr:hypothetical protein [archaeon]